MSTDALFETPAAGSAPVLPAAGQGPAGHRGEAVARPAGSVPPVASRNPAGPVLEIHVVGVPAPQGSKRGFVVGNRAIVVDDNKPKLRTWRDDVKQAALDALHHWHLVMANPSNPTDPSRQWQPLTEAELDITFLMPRPRGHFGTGRNAHQLRASSPTRPTTKPDVDKLLRSTLDALKVAGVYGDDSQVVTLTGRKIYAAVHPGAVIQIYDGSRP